MLRDPRPRPLAGPEGNAHPPDAPLPTWRRALASLTVGWAFVSALLMVLVMDVVFPATFGWEPGFSGWQARLLYVIGFVVVMMLVQIVVRGVGGREARSE